MTSYFDARRAATARGLERGVPSSAWRRLAERTWRACANVARPLALPSDVTVIGIGGAVLGGAGKTPLAIALATALARRARVTLVGHAYRAHPARPRVVTPCDEVDEVGDDALFAARALPGSVPVIVAPTRQRALDFAATSGAEIVVVDGLLQTRPVPLTRAVLVLDAAQPWGSGACPPLGDLRASPARLRAHADCIALVTPEGSAPAPDAPERVAVVPSFIDGARDANGTLHTLESLRALRRIGVVLAVARPARILDALRRAGLAPVVEVCLGDHDRMSELTLDVARRRRRGSVEVWLTSARCATKLPSRLAGAPVMALQHALDVGALTAALALSDDVGHAHLHPDFPRSRASLV